MVRNKIFLRKMLIYAGICLGMFVFGGIFLFSSLGIADIGYERYCVYNENSDFTEISGHNVIGGDDIMAPLQNLSSFVKSLILNEKIVYLNKPVERNRAVHFSSYAFQPSIITPAPIPPQKTLRPYYKLDDKYLKPSEIGSIDFLSKTPSSILIKYYNSRRNTSGVSRRNFSLIHHFQDDKIDKNTEKFDYFLNYSVFK